MPGLDADSSIMIGAIECWDEGVEEVIETLSSYAVRTVVCRWADRYKLINTISPGATQIGGLYLFNAIPYPENPALYAQRFTIKGIGVMSENPSGMVGYDKARVTFEYRTPKGGDPNGYTEIDVGTSILTLGRGGVTVETVNSDGNDPQPVLPSDSPGMPLPVISFTRGMRNLFGLPIGLIRAAAKKPINTRVFAGYQPGEVIFEGLRASKQTATNTGTGLDGNGNVPGITFTGFGDSDDATVYSGLWDAEFRFSARPGLPWDYLARFKDGAFDGFGRARYANGQGEFIGRSDIGAMLNRNSGPGIVVT